MTAALTPIDGLMAMAVPTPATITAPAPTHRVLSIDAWRDSEGGWDWNQWYDTGDTVNLAGNETTRQLLALLREQGVLTSASAGFVAVEEQDYGDSYQVVILARGTREPWIALEPLQ